jgi:large subunit ribosomal protein L24
MAIKKGENVLIISGKYKGKKSEVLSISKNGMFATVKGVNVVTKHQKPNQILKVPGGLVKKEVKIHISNIKSVK